jgi:4-amino-4-deoxy-L-arabinose transferase-like glycosyltransferase
MEQGTATSQPTEASSLDAERLDAAPAAPRAGSEPRKRVLGRHAPRWWPLAAVLLVQALLSIRLVRANTAFMDEAAYLWAGHLQWAHWLHGASVPPFSAYFSGAPVIYPPIGALADSVGGLAATRILSLIFMLGATTLLYGTITRLYGQRAAFFGSALFAILGTTLHLGAFATYDAMAVFLVALAVWLVTRADDQGEATGRMVAAGVVLALANATAYSTALFDPVVVLIALLTSFPKPGGKVAWRRAAIFLIVLVTLLLAGLLIGGSSYLHGIEKTTLSRAPGAASPGTVLTDFWSWAGLITILAVGGIVASWIGRQERTQTWLLVVVTIAAILGPLEQARLRTATSLDKHVGLGAWFAAIAAGYAVDRFIAAAHGERQTRNFTIGACVAALAFPLALGASQSWSFSTDWPNADTFVAILRPATQGSGRLLVEDPSIPEYYLPAGSDWKRWSSTRNIVLPSGRSTGGPSQSAGVVGSGNAGTFAAYIEEGYFSIVALNYQDTTALDYKITADLNRNRHYHKIAVVPYGVEIPPVGQGTYIIWRWERTLVPKSKQKP